MDSDQQPSAKRLSKEEYLIDDPLLKWVPQRKEALERLLEASQDQDEKDDFEQRIGALKGIEVHYLALAGQIARSNSETTILFELDSAWDFDRAISTLDDDGDLHDAPQWMQIACERRHRRQGGKRNVSRHMSKW